jgi:2-polyprenyl-6-methoxyphenol hydroxylase-like FAD-dependent oxidoreductase
VLQIVDSGPAGAMLALALMKSSFPYSVAVIDAESHLFGLPEPVLVETLEPARSS